MTRDIALNKPVTMSSLRSSSYLGSYANDGSDSTSSWTLNEVNPWLRLDLEAPYAIQFITIYGANYGYDCYIHIGNNGTSGVKNPFCTTILQESNENKAYECDNGVLEGQYVFFYGNDTHSHELYFYDINVYIF